MTEDRDLVWTVLTKHMPLQGVLDALQSARMQEDWMSQAYLCQVLDERLKKRCGHCGQVLPDRRKIATGVSHDRAG